MRQNGVWLWWFDTVERMIAIPGARDLLVRECAVGWTDRRQRYGQSYTLIKRELTERLPPVAEWCEAKAERSISDPEAAWIPKAMWDAHNADPLEVPFIPEFDERGSDLREVAVAEREVRLVRAMLADVERERTETLKDAAHARRSRRRIAEAAGLSVARVQQLITKG